MLVDEVHSPNTGLKIREEVRIDPLMNLYYTRRHAYQSISPSKKKKGRARSQTLHSDGEEKGVLETSQETEVLIRSQIVTQLTYTHDI